MLEAKDQGALQRKEKKRSSQKFFQAISKKKKKKSRSPQKNVFQKIFQPLHKILTIQKVVLSSSRGQANFRGLEASRPRPRLDLRGQGLQNVSSRTPPLIIFFVATK